MSDKHSLHQADLPIQTQILNISVNMARVSNLVLNQSGDKRVLIQKLINQTESYLNDLESDQVSEQFRPTLFRFQEEFKKLKNQALDENDILLWSEKALTWADILQIRAKLA